MKNTKPLAPPARPILDIHTGVPYLILAGIVQICEGGIVVVAVAAAEVVTVDLLVVAVPNSFDKHLASWWLWNTRQSLHFGHRNFEGLLAAEKETLTSAERDTPVREQISLPWHFWCPKPAYGLNRSLRAVDWDGGSKGMRMCLWSGL